VRHRLAVVAAVGLTSTVFATAQPQADRATVPLVVEGNRPFVDLTFQRKDGSTRTARVLIDSGGGDFLFTEALARDLGLTWNTPTLEDGSRVAEITTVPPVSIGAFPLRVNPQRLSAVIGEDTVLPKQAPGHADAILPGHVLAQYHVVFDYPGATFTIARAGVLTPTGEAIAMPVGRGSGFPRTEIEVAGERYGLLLDTGASFTMVSATLLASWRAAHPEWPWQAGAAGEAATLGGATIETLSLPGGRWGTLDLPAFGVVSRRAGVFERSMSAMMGAPIVGSLAGNVLKRFRIELDYPNQRLYLSVRPSARP
jgi:hypothetical protein